MFRPVAASASGSFALTYDRVFSVTGRGGGEKHDGVSSVQKVIQGGHSAANPIIARLYLPRVISECVTRAWLGQSGFADRAQLPIDRTLPSGISRRDVQCNKFRAFRQAESDRECRARRTHHEYTSAESECAVWLAAGVLGVASK
jgi:hypothetical protein